MDAPQTRTDAPRVKATLLAVSALTVLSSMTLSPDLPAIREHFRAAPDADTLVRLVLTLHALFIVLGAPLAGYVADRFGRKRLLILAALAYGLAGSAGSLLDGLPALLTSRALLGLATAGTMTGATTLIADYYTGRTRTQLAAWQAAAMNFGGVAATLASGVLAGVSWRLPFLIYLVGIALVLPIAATLVEPARDAPGVPPSRGGARGMDRAPRGALFAIYGFMFAMMLLFFVIPVQLPFYLHGTLHVGAAQNGVALAAPNLCTGLVALAYGRLARRLDRLGLVALGFTGLGTGLLLIGVAPAYLPVVAGTFLAGSVQGVLLPTLGLWIMGVTPIAARGRAVSGLTASIFVGQFLSPFVSQPLGRAVGLGALFPLAGAAALAVAASVALRRRQVATAAPVVEMHR